MKYITVFKLVVKCQPGRLFEQFECILHIARANHDADGNKKVTKEKI